MERDFDSQKPLNQKYTIEELLKIMQFLRSPQGCPWDREQTHQSLRQHLLEEAYETVTAIDHGSSEELSSELGDVLLQVVFHAVLAEEEGTFTLDTIIDKLCRKLIFRHSHVFHSDQADSSAAVVDLWEKNKQKEQGASTASILQGVGEGLTALQRAHKLQRKAGKYGFDWPDYSGAREKITEELLEIEAILPLLESEDPLSSEGVRLTGELEEEVGDLFFSVVNYARLLGVSSETALNRTNNKFMRRFMALEQLAAARGIMVEKASLAELDELWDEVKRGEHNS